MASISTSRAGGGVKVPTEPPRSGSSEAAPLVWVLGVLTVLMLSGVAWVATAAAPEYGIDATLAAAIAVAVVLAVAGLIAVVHAWANVRRS